MSPKAIITFNICGLPYPSPARARVQEFARLVEQSDANIINLQELHAYGLLGLLRSHLPSYPYVAYRPWLVGPRAGLVTFSKFPIGQPDFSSFSFHRGVLASRLKNGTVVMNAHLVANTDGDWSRTNRFYPKHKQQLDRLLEVANGCGDAPLILTGDFNLAKSCDLYGEFVKAGGWKDAFGSEMVPTFHQEFLPPDRVAQCVDYIFVRGGAGEFGRVEQLFRDKVALKNGRRVYLSNHIGLYGERSGD